MFNLQKRSASHKDYSFKKSHKLGAVQVPEFIIPSQILDQGNTEDCTAFSAVGARMSEISGAVFDPSAFWNDELAFAGVQTSTGFDLGVPAAVSVKVGFCPSGNPSVRGNQASAYFWLHSFEEVMQAMYQTKYVAIGGVEWEQSWTSNPYITTTGGVVLGGHAIRIVGMKIMSDGRYAVLANTWSEQVGDKGYWYIREDVFNKKFSEYGIYILSDSQDIKVKTLGLISALYTNILTLLKNFSPLKLLK